MQQECQPGNAARPHRLPSILDNTHAAFPVVEAQPGEEPLPPGLLLLAFIGICGFLDLGFVSSNVLNAICRQGGHLVCKNISPTLSKGFVRGMGGQHLAQVHPSIPRYTLFNLQMAV